MSSVLWPNARIALASTTRVETFRDAIIIVASTLKPDPDQFAFLSKKGEEGYAAANCFGWEQARDVIVNYRDLSEKPHRTSNTG
jgi:hypothetical protein